MPPKIKMPPARQANNCRMTVLLIVVCWAVAFYSNPNLYQHIAVGATIIFSSAVLEGIQRVRMLCQEHQYLATHYDRDLNRLACRVFYFSKQAMVCMIVAGAVFLIFMEHQPPDGMFCFYIFLTCAVSLLQPIFQFKDNPIYKSYQIESDEMDVAAYMAISFFHGYLNLTLQRQPDRGSGLVHAMEIYEDHNHIRFPRKVLFILLPKSMYCPHRLTDKSEIMEEAQTLEPVEKDIAGVKRRNYKNSVYKIKDPKEGYFYVVAEYASPLRTFYESTVTDGLFKQYFDNHKQEVIYKFYKTLERLVREDDNMRGLCEFIYFDDKDKYGNDVDIGIMLLKRLVEGEEAARR